ncbi:hypothetical protein D623_10001961 [Myotis brandtii]|uniref:Beta-defensin n=1 Tax=Myotis brandtii TaxID=109478 RepID=S7NHD3_MYOBR|nr:hypothetical protein D623_10001961 [Myotis brandtii]
MARDAGIIAGRAERRPPPCTNFVHMATNSTGALNFERPCYLRGGICLKRGTPNCKPIQGPCRAFTICCRIKRNQ